MSKIVVGFDARLLTREKQPTGVGRYVRHLTAALRQIDTIELLLYTDQALCGGGTRPVRKLPGLPWQQTALRWALRKDKPAVYHGPSFSVPLNVSTPCVVTVHDLSFERYPGYVQEDTLRYLRRMVPMAVRHAARVITPSSQVAQEIVEVYRLDNREKKKIRVIPLGVDLARWRPSAPEALSEWRRKHGLEFPYLVFVGTREPRKNLHRLVTAFDMVAGWERDIHLVLAGPAGFDSTVDRSIAGCDRIHTLPYVGDLELPRLVEAAVGLCYVSEYEGFGLPVLEAMAVGTPVLTTRNSPMQDILGAWGLYAAPDNAEDIAEGLRRLIGESEGRRGQRDAVRSVARKYSWEETARRTVDVYRELL